MQSKANPFCLAANDVGMVAEISTNAVCAASALADTWNTLGEQNSLRESLYIDVGIIRGWTPLGSRACEGGRKSARRQ
jgi:hypothetical protein